MKRRNILTTSLLAFTGLFASNAISKTKEVSVTIPFEDICKGLSYSAKYTDGGFHFGRTIYFKYGDTMNKEQLVECDNTVKKIVLLSNRIYNPKNFTAQFELIK